MGKFVILYDFVVMEMDESSQVSIILRRSFLTSARAMIDMPVRKTSFQLCGEKVDFYFPPPMAFLLTAHSIPMVLTVFALVSKIEVFEGDGALDIRYCAPFDLS